MGERIPLVRAAGGGCECWVARKTVANGSLVSEGGGAVDAVSRDLGVAGEDGLGMLESAGGVPAVGIDAGGGEEGTERIGQVFDGAGDAERFDMHCECGPRVEAVLAREHKLGIGEGDGCALGRR